jgi:hypothetical protein
MRENWPQIYSTGLVCPLGETFIEATQAYANGKFGLRKGIGICGLDGLPLTLAFVYRYNEPRDYGERLRRLISGALAQCREAVERLAPPAQIPLHIVLPQWMEKHPSLAELNGRIQRSHSWCGSLTFHFGGPAESLALVSQLAATVYRGQREMVLLCAADSYIFPALLDHLSDAEVVLNQNNPYGFVPGEAACALLISRETFIRGRIPSQGSIEWVKTSAEPENIQAPQGVIGRGLAICFNLGKQWELARLLIDLNGERYRAEEFGFAIAASPQDLMHLANDPEAPALQMGDLGSATGLVYAALALAEPKKRPDAVPGNAALISISSRSGARATMIVARS